MTKGRKTGGKDFEPGNPGGPGQPTIPPELKAARRLNKVEFELIANKYVFATKAELEAAQTSPSTPAMEMLLVNIMLSGIFDGDQAKAEFFLNRLIGKVKDEVEVTVVKPFIITRLNGDQIEMGSTKIEEKK